MHVSFRRKIMLKAIGQPLQAAATIPRHLQCCKICDYSSHDSGDDLVDPALDFESLDYLSGVQQICRRYPPKPSLQPEAIENAHESFSDWTVVRTSADDWCGEFKPREGLRLAQTIANQDSPSAGDGQ
jgi:hypothetical protein